MLLLNRNRVLVSYLPAKIHKFRKGPLETCKPQSNTEKQAEVLCRSEVIVILLDLKNGKVIV